MAIIGLTGGIGSGKSEAAGYFAALGVPVIDTDVIAHQLTQVGSPVLTAIVAQFGQEILSAEGELKQNTLNRDALRKVVFNNVQARHALEAIMHPAIRAEVQRALIENTQKTAINAPYQIIPYQIIVVPLLFETQHYKNIIAHSLVIDCDEETQVARTLARHRQKIANLPQATQSSLTEADVRAIIAAQLSRAARLKQADEVILNDGSSADLQQNVLKMHEKFIHLCKNGA